MPITTSLTIHEGKTVRATSYPHLSSAPVVINVESGRWEDLSRADIVIHTENPTLAVLLADAINEAMEKFSASKGVEVAQ